MPAETVPATSNNKRRAIEGWRLFSVIMIPPVDADEHRLVHELRDVSADDIGVLAREAEMDAGEDASIVDLCDRRREAREAANVPGDTGRGDRERRCVSEHRGENRRGRAADAGMTGWVLLEARRGEQRSPPGLRDRV